MNNKTHDEACCKAAIDLAAYWADLSRSISQQWIRVAEMYRGRLSNEKRRS